jgi:hypothetical protein
MSRVCSCLSVVVTLSLLGGHALAEDAPIALEKWGRYHANIVPYMPTTMPPKGKKVVWVPKVSLVFKVTSPESDDIVELQHFQGRRKWGPVQKCQIQSSQMIKRRGAAGATTLGYSLVVPVCLMDEKLAISKTGTFSVEVSYKQTGAGKLHEKLATYTYQVKNYNAVWPGGKGRPTKAYYVDHDFRMGEAWLYINSDGKLEIWTWFKHDRKGEQLVRGGRVRCFNGDKKLSFYENPTARTTVDYEHYSKPLEHQKITWGLYYWWTGRVDGMTPAEWLKKNPGSYRCTLTQAGDISRELSFEVGADGAVKPAPCEGSGPGQVHALDTEHLIKTTFKKNPDLKFDRAAFRKMGLYGQKWARGCPL